MSCCHVYLQNSAHDNVITWLDKQSSKGRSPGGGILPMIGYTGRLRPKGVPFYDLGMKEGMEK